MKSGHLTGRPDLSQRGKASNREAVTLTGRPGPPVRGLASHREARPLTEIWGSTERLGLSQKGWASDRKPGPFTDCSKLKKNTNKNLIFLFIKC